MLVANTSTQLKFRKLVKNIYSLPRDTQWRSTWAFNRVLIIRNWLIGSEIIHYERASKENKKEAQVQMYQLKRLTDSRGLPNFFMETVRNLYLNYPQIEELLNPKATPRIDNTHPTTTEKLVDGLSFSHFVELLRIGDPVIRNFYENECVRKLWSVNELRRLISYQLHKQVYKKSFISLETAMESLFEIRENKYPCFPIDDPYLQEAMDHTWKVREYFSEKDPRKRLLIRLENFFLDLDMRFGYIATQKELKIDGGKYVADLVFFNIRLHCMMIIQVREEEFRQEHVEELQTILSYYRQNDMNPGDIPPIGIIIGTQKKHRHIEYVISGSNIPFYASAYVENLPSEKQLNAFLENVVD